MTPDITIQCVDCKTDFTFTKEEQDFYASRDLETPKRCKSCRATRKLKNNSK